jgi:hypothetical protein
MVVVALRGSNIPVLPVPKHKSVSFLQVRISAHSRRDAEENRIDVPLTRNLLPAVPRKLVQRRPMWFINETK